MDLKNLIIPAVVGLGLYAQSNNLNLSNNTTALLEMLLLLNQQQEITTQRAEIEQLNVSVYGTPWPYRQPYYATSVASYATPYYTRTSSDCCV